MTEFCLNVYCSYKTFIPIEHIDKVNDGKQYNIYAILTKPRVYIKQGSIEKLGDTLNFELYLFKNGKKEQIVIKNFYLGRDTEEIEFEISDNEEQIDITINGKKEIPFRAEWFYQQYCYQNNIVYELEVLYVGQAFGKNGEKTAQERLKNHSTLQKILTDYFVNNRDKTLFALLMEMTDQHHLSMDGITDTYQKSDEEDLAHMEQVLKAQHTYRQIINITEAAIINYFKPEYNTNFIDNFPSDTHAGYKTYFDLDYNLLVVELDMELDNFPQIVLYTKHNKINNPWEFIEYKLYNDPNRTVMYEIFSDSNEDE